MLSALVLSMSACGGLEEPQTGSIEGRIDDAKPFTVQQALASLEANGSLPKLDRTDALLGIDSNDDGVRDDLAAYIDSLPDTEVQKKALRRTARAVQSALEAGESGDVKMARMAVDKINIASACVFRAYDIERIAFDKSQEMQKLTVNARARYDVYLRFNRSMSGIVITLPRSPVCD